MASKRYKKLPKKTNELAPSLVEKLIPEYSKLREREYTSIREQLDMQYWDSVNDTTTWKDHIASVKDQFPKV